MFKSVSLCNQVNLILEWVSEWSRLVMADSLRPHGLWPIRLPHPWDFPSKNTGLDCHFLLHNIGIGHGKREEWQKKRSDGNRDKIHRTNLPKKKKKIRKNCRRGLVSWVDWQKAKLKRYGHYYTELFPLCILSLKLSFCFQQSCTFINHLLLASLLPSLSASWGNAVYVIISKTECKLI